jgi:hypothetical protein
MTTIKDLLFYIANGTKIVATSMTLNTTDCDELCDPTITVIWQNTGKRNTFRPAIKVNGNKIEKGIEVTLNKNEYTSPITFNLTNLVEGTYEICPDPN